MIEADIFHSLILIVFMLAGVVFVLTGTIVAPFGRHTRKGWGPTLPARWGWIIMESPTLWLFVIVFGLGARSDELLPRIFAGLWLLHYVHRTLIYPARMRARGKTMPWLICLLAFCWSLLNSYLNARSLTELGPSYELSWLLSFRFLYGLLLFVTGFIINRVSDATLLSLRKRGETGYQIPRGGLFEEVSCPNHLGEIIQWLGWAVMTWSEAGLAFAVFTIANLVPRAVAHHNWYHRTFPDYPKNRRAVIPLLL